jgi:hypothetical protein
MVQRGIPHQEVETVLREPDRIELSIKGRENAFRSTPDGVVRVTYRETEREFLVVPVGRQRPARETQS